MQQPFGTVAVPLPKDRHQLDEDGVVYVRRRFPTRIALKFASHAPELEDIIPAIVAGWRIKAGGIELVYSEERANELPVDVLEAIRDYIGAAPLDSVATANGSSTPSGDPPRQPAPAAGS